jgi:hypothetical protein
MTSKNTRKRGLIVGGTAALLVAGMATGGALVTDQSTIFKNIFGTTTESSDLDSSLKAHGDPMVIDFDGSIDGEMGYAFYDLENIVKGATEGSDLKVTGKVQERKTGPDYSADFNNELLNKLDVETTVDGGSTWVSAGKLGKMSADFGQVNAGETNEVGIRVVNKTGDGFSENLDRTKKAIVDFQFDAVGAN